jgi:hypothetical protein
MVASLGGGIACFDSSPVLQGCVLAFNRGEKELELTHINNFALAGAVSAYRSSPEFYNCTIGANYSYWDYGTYTGGIDCREASQPILTKTIISFSTSGSAVHCDETSSASLSCCDLYGNEGGDWVGSIEGFLEVDGNIWADPLYCEPVEWKDHVLNEDSPCLPANHPDGEDCDTIGARGPVCTAAATEDAENLSDVLRLEAAAPNPFSPSTNLTYSIPSRLGGSNIQLKIYDLSGRLVRTLVDGPGPAGPNGIVWDGRNENGEIVVAGVYACRLSIGEQKVTRRLVLVR